jgi:general secretion pathway protein M
MMPKLSREKYLAIAALVALVLIGAIAPTMALLERSDAEQALSDERDLVSQLVAAKQRANKQKQEPMQLAEAPPEAFLKAQTAGLAIAQLEAYFSTLAQANRANLVSASAQPADQSDAPDIVRVQVNIEVEYEALQPLLYKLETGAPYVFVDSLRLRSEAPSSNKGRQRGLPLKATLGLKAIWRSSSI